MEGDRQGRAPVKQPQLLLIDDEPALADFVANAARECGFMPIVTSDDSAFREQLRAQAPDAVALDLGMPVDGIELLRFLSDEEFAGPVLIISGFDRRVLDAAFRLGEALGLTMRGPLEKPVRLEELEALLMRMKPVVQS
jgi:DNA-binding response OmpR family regulator